MRILIGALLSACFFLFGSAANANTFTLSPGTYTLYGNFAAYGGDVIGTLGYAWVSGGEVLPGNYDPINGPFWGYGITAYANEGEALETECWYWPGQYRNVTAAKLTVFAAALADIIRSLMFARAAAHPAVSSTWAAAPASRT